MGPVKSSLPVQSFKTLPLMHLERLLNVAGVAIKRAQTQTLITHWWKNCEGPLQNHLGYFSESPLHSYTPSLSGFYVEAEDTSPHLSPKNRHSLFEKLCCQDKTNRKENLHTIQTMAMLFVFYSQLNVIYLSYFFSSNFFLQFLNYCLPCLVYGKQATWMRCGKALWNIH